MASIKKNLAYYKSLADDAATHTTLAKLALLHNMNNYFIHNFTHNMVTRSKNEFIALACNIRNLIDMDYARHSLGRRPTQDELLAIFHYYNTVNIELQPNGIHLEAGIWLTDAEIANL
jgi:hypothetical protein